MQPMRGIMCKILSVILMIAMAALIKATAHHVPPGEAVFFRSAFAIPVIIGWLWWTGSLKDGVGTKNPMGHFLRAIIGTTSMVLIFATLGYLPLPEATAIGYLAPLLLVLFAAYFLGEKVGPWRLSAVGLGLVGVLIVIWPRLTVEDMGVTQMIGVIIAVAGAVFNALAQMTVRYLARIERTATIVFWFSLNAAILSLLTLPFGWVMPTPAEAGMLVVAGLLGGAGQILLTSSYRFADAGVVAPFEYASILFALVIGYVAFDEVPTWAVIGGAALVTCAGLIIVWRERQLGLERNRQRKAMGPAV